MKVLIAGVYKDGTGYGHGTIDMAMSCDAAGIDVVCRPITMTGINRSIQNKLEKFEKKDVCNVDAVIQYCLPSCFEYVCRAKNIGSFAWETSSIQTGGWHRYCNLMDQIWVMCEQQKFFLSKNKIIKPVYSIPNGCDPQKFEQRYGDFPMPIKDKMVFYTIAENNRRKNLPNLIRSFFYAFTARDNVILFIKSNGGDDGYNNIANTIKDIKKGLHIHSNEENYPKIVVITQNLPEDVICSIHTTCDVFVTMSKGEAWCIPAHDAMGFGNPVIAPNWGSFPELLSDQGTMYLNGDTFKNQGIINTGWLIDGMLSPCFGMVNTPNGVYDGRELWYEPSILECAKAMKSAYDMWCDDQSNFLKMRENAKKRALNFSYEKVGNIIKGVLSE